jgi:hypothetical protein
LDESKIIASYQRDKYLAADLHRNTPSKIDNSGGWTISLKDEKTFVFRGTDKTINGTWRIDKKEDNDYFINLDYNESRVNCRINGNIIYFDRPTKLFDSLFKDVIFVRVTRTIE